MCNFNYQISTIRFQSPSFFKFLIVNILLVFSVFLAAETGRISGTVRSVSTAEALPGTNILLKGTLLGAASDLGGEFRILNVPPGDYTLEVLNIGYQSI